MGSTSASTSNPWAPYDSYKDCSQGICSIYCPQWCYIIFPPPPPFNVEDDSGADFSPLIIAVIGILASAFILVSYYTIISKYCRRRRHDDDTTSGIEFHDNHAVNNNNDPWQSGNNGGLDEGLIKSITVCKYKKGDGLVEGSDCSVCLSEFLEDESLRLLPKCNHAFHLPCIDTWLKSHSNCPLCRANIQAPLDHHNPPQPETGVNSVNQYQHRSETVLVIHQVAESGVGVVNLVDDDDDDGLPKTPIQGLRGDVENLGQRHNNTSDQVGFQIQPIRRSVSLNSSVCQGHVLVADILSSDDDDDDYQMEKNRSNKVLNLVRNTPLALKRSVSTGRFMWK
ncbi:hypothetical protein ACOSQ4_014253 [Xanthoceras sorbifolium]